MISSERTPSLLVVFVFLLPLSLPALHAFRTPLNSDTVKPGYRSGYISNEALPPDESEKELEKRQRAFEKFKTLRDYQSSTNSAVGDKEVKETEHKVEEYFVEHEISLKSARAETKQMNITLLSQAVGCEECTHKEMEYCSGTQIISDHCCCDGRYKEVFPYIPHTCYLGSVICRPVAADCGEYMRIRDCCCNKYLAKKWKATLSNASTKSMNPFIKFFCIAFGILCSCVVLRLIFTGN